MKAEGDVSRSLSVHIVRAVYLWKPCSYTRSLSMSADKSVWASVQPLGKNSEIANVDVQLSRTDLKITDAQSLSNCFPTVQNVEVRRRKCNCTYIFYRARNACNHGRTPSVIHPATLGYFQRHMPLQVLLNTTPKRAKPVVIPLLSNSHLLILLSLCGFLHKA